MKVTGATLKDIEQIQRLLKSGIDDGAILFRSDDVVATNIRSYITVRTSKGTIIGVTALHIHTKELGEVRSLFVDSDYRNQGVAHKLLLKAIDNGKELGLKQILTLTYRDSLFKRLDFKEIEKSSLPNSKIWADCMSCKHFPVCDEVALLKEI